MTFKDKAAIAAMEALLRHFDFHTFAQDTRRVALWAWEVAEHLDAIRKEASEDGDA